MRSLVRFQLAPPPPFRVGLSRLGRVKNLRRGLLVALMALLAGIVVRARGRSPVPPTSGGWRELEGPDLR